MGKEFFDYDFAFQALNRARVSQPRQEFASKQLFGKDILLWNESLQGSGTAVYTSPSTRLSVTASASDSVIRQSKIRMNYSPGDAVTVVMTGTLPTATGVTSRVGYFIDDGTGTYMTPYNGVWFENNAGTLSWNLASNGVVTTVTQQNWNLDHLDGDDYDLNPSSVTLDPDTFQIFLIDFIWLGGGPIRVGFKINNMLRYCHEFQNTNLGTDVIFADPNLPLRYDIQSDGTGAGYLDSFCAAVKSEGNLNPKEINKAISRGTSAYTTGTNTDLHPLISIRLQNAYLNGYVDLLNASAICTSTADFEWSVILNPTVAGTDAAVWTAVSASVVEYDITRNNTNTLTGGYVVANGTVEAGGGSAAGQISSALRLGATIARVRDEFVLAVRSLSGQSETFYGTLGWIEAS